jgi:hypothetical protein
MSRGRKLAFSLLVLLVAVGGIEAVSWSLSKWGVRVDLGAALSAVASSDEEDETVFEARRRIRGPRARSEVIHPYVGFVVAPSGYPDEVGLEALGFPGGGPLVRSSAPDRATWLVFGGSLAGEFVGYDGPARAFAELQDLPDVNGKQLVVLSAALAGYKQPQSLLALAYLLSLGVQVDAVLLIDGFNEVALAPAENVPVGVFPFFPRAWGRRVANLSFATGMRTRIGEIALLAHLRAESARRLDRSLLRFSPTARLGWWLLDRTLAARITAGRLDLVTPSFRAPFDYLTHGPPWPTDDRAALFGDLVSVWKHGSLQMHLLCEGYGVRFYHFLQPNQYVPDSKPIGEEERLVALAPVHLYRRPVEEGYPLLRRAGRELVEEGVRFHDLTQLFAEVPEPIYVDTCCHVGERGNELLALAIAEAIRVDVGQDDAGSHIAVQLH